MKCPICNAVVTNCPFCQSNKSRPESLVLIIQNIDQTYTKIQRDQALIDITVQFKYLIQKIAKYLYQTYRLKEVKYTWVDFHQDVLLEFYDLVINDFKIKQQGDNTLAVFGNYIKNKLYRRVQYSIQKKIKKYGWDHEFSMDLNHEDIYIDHKKQMGSISRDIYEATIGGIMEYEDQELAEIRDERCIEILKQLHQISLKKKICSEIDGEIWRLHWFSGKSVQQIDEHLSNEKDYGCKLGESRIRQIVKKTNQQILSEFGRISGLGAIQ
jgi:hypothetical protein